MWRLFRDGDGVVGERGLFLSVFKTVSTRCVFSRKIPLVLNIYCMSFFVNFALFPLSTFIRAGVAVQGPLVKIYTGTTHTELTE